MNKIETNYNKSMYKIQEQSSSDIIPVMMQLLVDMVSSYHSVFYRILVKYTE